MIFAPGRHVVAKNFKDLSEQEILALAIRIVSRHFPSHVPDERGRPAARETVAGDRIAWDARCSPGASRACL